MAGDAGALLGDGLLGDLNQDLLSGLQQVGDDRQVGGLHGAARRLRVLCPDHRGAPRPRRPRAPRSRRWLRLAFAGGLAVGADGLFFLVFLAVKSVFGFFIAVLVVEVQLDAMVEVRFLQHLAQFAGADLGLELVLFFVLVEVVLVSLVMMMRKRRTRLPRLLLLQRGRCPERKLRQREQTQPWAPLAELVESVEAHLQTSSSCRPDQTV